MGRRGRDAVRGFAWPFDDEHWRVILLFIGGMGESVSFLASLGATDERKTGLNESGAEPMSRFRPDGPEGFAASSWTAGIERPSSASERETLPKGMDALDYAVVFLDPSCPVVNHDLHDCAAA